jgi:hypothetical protein
MQRTSESDSVGQSPSRGVNTGELIERLIFLPLPPSPREWSVRARRAFVLTLPLSGPCFIAWFALWVCWAVLAMVVLMFLLAAAWAVSPLFAFGFWLSDFVGDLWFDPASSSAVAKPERAPPVPAHDTKQGPNQ